MKNLVIAVSPDSSLELLGHFADIVVLDKDSDFSETVSYDSVYIRSHFGQQSTLPQNFRSEIDDLILRVKNRNPNVLFVDGIDTVDKILAFEDKWNQCVRFERFMPRTEIYGDTANDSTFTRPIFKKRLSSRGVGVTWNKDKADRSTGEWLIQESLNIKEELRVYIICGEVHTTAAVKQSMDEGGRSQAVAIRELAPDEIKFASDIAERVPELDIIGLDLARTTEGPLMLMEVNRSPGFAKFEELSGVNLAAILYEKLAD
jgi:glutathione synthase/RimK-type ligase-like ATP-grasp enzyme